MTAKINAYHPAACHRMPRYGDAEPVSLDQTYHQHVTRLMANTHALLTEQSLDGVLIFSGRPRRRFLDDHDFPFVANPHFNAWLPLPRHANGALLIRPGQRPVLYYFNPDDFWHLPAGTPRGSWTDCFDIVDISHLAQIGTLLPKRQHLAFIGEEADLAQHWGIDAVNPPALLHALSWQRAIKSDYEIACIRQANQRAVLGHRAAERAFRNGDSEFAIQQVYLAATQHGESELPYGNIIALNEHGAVLHYQQRDRQAPETRHGFLIDAGADCHGYAADITRTYAAQPGLFGDLILALDAAQLALIDRIRPGSSFVDLHQSMHLTIGELLHRFDLVRASAESLVDNGITRLFYPHGLGHLLGLQVHDVGGLQSDAAGTPLPPPAAHPFLRLTRPLEAGMVVTIEPGLYFIPSMLEKLRRSPVRVNWQAIDNLRKYGGIRIEDNIVLHEDKTENLTREAFQG